MNDNTQVGGDRGTELFLAAISGIYTAVPMAGLGMLPGAVVSFLVTLIGASYSARELGRAGKFAAGFAVITNLIAITLLDAMYGASQFGHFLPFWHWLPFYR